MTADHALPVPRTHRARGSRRARWCLVWMLTCFALAQAGFWWIKETVGPELRDPEYAHKLRRVQQRVRDNPGRPLVLLLGSSRIGFGFHADVLDCNRAGGPGEPLVFNFGMCQCTPVLQRIMLRRLLADGIRPAVVLVEWYPPFMQAGAVQADEFMNPIRLNWPDLQTLVGFSDQPGRLRGRWVELQLAGIYAHRHTALNRYAIAWVARPERFDDQWAGMTPWGWTPNHHLARPREPANLAEYIVQRAADYQSLFADWEPSKQSDAALRAILRDLGDAGIPAALFWAPEPAWMRRWYSPDALARIGRYLDALCRDYRAPLVDARDWLPDELFFEEMHPLHTGAASLARRFERQALPLLQSGRLWAGGGGMTP